MNVEDVKKCIIDSFHEKKNSHAFLLSTNNFEKAYEDVISIVKHINCLNDAKVDCDCNICHTITNGNNPDVITINPDGKEIKKDQILDIIRLFSTKPLVCNKSIYIVNHADRMNDSAANKILKFLEEPEGNILGFFITDNVQGVIPTIRSRCEFYNFKYGADNLLSLLEISEDDFGKYYDLCLDLIYKLNGSPSYVLMAESKNIALKDRKEIETILKLLRKIYLIKYENVMNGLYSDLEYAVNLLESITVDDIKIIVKRINLLDNIINDFKINVNKELFINKLFVLWE